MNRKTENRSGDQLRADLLAAALGADQKDISLCVLEEIDSTNNEAKRRAVAGQQTPMLIVAESQTAGRGRMGRSFYSPASTGVYLSILLPTAKPLQSAVSLTGAAAVAVMRAIRTLTGKQTAIKWVNDLYLNGKKVCGILAEALSGLHGSNTQYLILGIGVNLCTERFPTELAAIAGSVESDIRRVDLIAQIWKELKPYLSDFSDRTWLADYRAYSCVIGKPISWKHGEKNFEGVAVGINDDGELEVQAQDGTRGILRTGEISVRILSDNSAQS